MNAAQDRWPGARTEDPRTSLFVLRQISASGRRLVAQVSNLPYRRLPVGNVPVSCERPAGWKPATQQVGNLRYVLRRVIACETAGLAAILWFSAGLATAADVWPAQTQPLNESMLKLQLDALDTAVKSLPSKLLPALQYEKLYWQMISGAPAAAWRPKLEQDAQLAGDDPVATAVRELARVWLARVRMQEIETALLGYYRANVAFPPLLDAVMKEIPAAAQKDPWDQPWVYKPLTPAGLKRHLNQRYQLGPTRHPQLAPFKDAIRQRTPPAAAWKITPRSIGTGTALEFRSTGAEQSVATLEPGGLVAGNRLVFIGDHWALMAGLDQFFTVNY